MKKNKDKAVTEGETKIPQLSIVPGVAVIAVSLAAVFSLIFVFLWRSDMMVMYFGGMLSSSFKQTSDTESSSGNILLPSETEVILSGDMLFTPDFSHVSESREKMAELLRSVRVYDCYEQILSVSYNEGPAEEITVWRDGARYRVESADSLVICDGETVYLRRSLEGFEVIEHFFPVEDSSFSPEEEMGIPVLRDIIADIEVSETLPKINFDAKEKIVMLSDIAHEGLVKAVSLTYETGMTLYVSAATADGTHLYRCFSEDYTLDPGFPKDAFKVPLQ
ncbi:MAG: hypothetical protein E7638_02895 [Ruminococcaceae bacterium]|nr:hypothetical protein [Oscillospiraceae bacterium]